MKHVTEQCGQMMPIIRPVFTTLLKDGKTFVSAEIPGMDVADRPCFYAGKGRLKVSYVRVGDADQPMTEYEIYSYEAFRRKYQDDIRPIEQAALRMLQTDLLEQYLAKLKEGRPHLSQLNAEEICELMGITRDGVPTMAAVQLFGLFPQAYFPQMCVTAVSVPGTEVGTLGPEGERFLDNRRIERTLSQMLEDTVSFVRRNIRIKTVIDPETGKRANREDYPPTAVREAILNALIHRDYTSIPRECLFRPCCLRTVLRCAAPADCMGGCGSTGWGKCSRIPAIPYWPWRWRDRRKFCVNDKKGQYEKQRLSQEWK